jgi:hypothetical protein
MTCDACHEKSYMQKQLSICDPPNTLVIHLKRFDFMRQRKITTKVDFPIFGLNLGVFTAQSRDSEPMLQLQQQTVTVIPESPKRLIVPENTDLFPNLLLGGKAAGSLTDQSLFTRVYSLDAEQESIDSLPRIPFSNISR